MALSEVVDKSTKSEIECSDKASLGMFVDRAHLERSRRTVNGRDIHEKEIARSGSVQLILL